MAQYDIREKGLNPRHQCLVISYYYVMVSLEETCRVLHFLQ